MRIFSKLHKSEQLKQTRQTMKTCKHLSLFSESEQPKPNIRQHCYMTKYYTNKGNDFNYSNSFNYF